jgi:hypothetical protein
MAMTTPWIPPAEFHVGDTTPIVLQFYDQNQAIVNINKFTQLTFTFQMPDGKTTFDRVAALLTDGSDGKAVYYPVLTDFIKKGRWRIQGFVMLSGGQLYSTDRSFEIVGTLKNPAN